MFVSSKHSLYSDEVFVSRQALICHYSDKVFVSRQALTWHDRAMWHVAIRPQAFAGIVQITPRVAVVIVEDAAVVAGRCLVLVGGVRAVKFVYL